MITCELYQGESGDIFVLEINTRDGLTRQWWGPFNGHASAFEWSLLHGATAIPWKGLVRGEVPDVKPPASAPEPEEDTAQASPEPVSGTDASRGARSELIADIAGLSVVKMRKRLGELTRVELLILLEGEDRSSAKGFIEKALEEAG